ncbi:TRAF family protein [Trifolium repens]|nr:TRAF family protein [Trifolium repens]
MVSSDLETTSNKATSSAHNRAGSWSCIQVVIRKEVAKVMCPYIWQFEMKKEWGFEQLISLEELFDSSNGYFVDDSCVFGAEVFVIRRCNKLESLYMVNDPPQVSLTCKLERIFDKLHF